MSAVYDIACQLAREEIARGAFADDVARDLARVAGENLRRHMLATEAIMRALAARLGEDPDLWGLAGLAHDLDCEETGDDFSRQGVVAAETLANQAAIADQKAPCKCASVVTMPRISMVPMMNAAPIDSPVMTRL